MEERAFMSLSSFDSLRTGSLREGSPARPLSEFLDFCALARAFVRQVLPVVGFLCGGFMDNWWVYIVEKKTGLYVGITTDLENRTRQHGQPAPLFYEGPISKSDALKRERTFNPLFSSRPRRKARRAE